MTTEKSRLGIYGDDSSACKELRDYKVGNLLRQKRRQQLRVNNHELRQLERQLRSALVFKQLREQQQNIAQEKECELHTEREENAKLALECEKIRESILQEGQREKKKKEAICKILNSQMRDQQQKRRKEFEDIKKDCEKMENLLEQVHAEEMAQRNKAQLLRAKFNIEMEESRRYIKLQEQLEELRIIDDTQRNLAYQEEYDRIKSQMVAERKNIQKEKEERSEGIGQQLAIINQEKEYRANLLLSLLIEERKAKYDQQYREDLVKQFDEREKLRSDMEKFRQEIKIREKQFKVEEEIFLKEHLSYLEERDKIIQLSDRKRRQKKMEHSKALREMLDIRRYQKANEIAARIADYEKTIIDEKNSDQLIKDERMRMLNAVPKELLSYLPPGVLRSSDKEFLTLTEQKKLVLD